MVNYPALVKVPALVLRESRRCPNDCDIPLPIDFSNTCLQHLDTCDNPMASKMASCIFCKIIKGKSISASSASSASSRFKLQAPG